MRSGKKYPRMEVLQDGRVAQLGEHLLCKQGVTGSIPVTSTNLIPALSSTYAATSTDFCFQFFGTIGTTAAVGLSGKSNP